MDLLDPSLDHVFSLEKLGVHKGPFLGMDWGKKRVGLAISDADNRVAMPLKVVPAGGPLRGVLVSLWQDYQAQALIIGWPKHLGGQLSPLCSAIGRLALRLRTEHGWPIALWDERLTSQGVSAVTLDRKAITDHHAAALILQGALDRWHHLIT